MYGINKEISRIFMNFVYLKIPTKRENSKLSQYFKVLTLIKR